LALGVRPGRRHLSPFLQWKVKKGRISHLPEDKHIAKLSFAKDFLDKKKLQNMLPKFPRPILPYYK
jgi:hypothetical protein